MITSAAARLTSGGDLEALRDRLASAGRRYTQTIADCGGTGCQAYGCQQVIDAFAQELARRGLQDTVRLRATGCHGFCERGPLAVLQPSGIFYQQIRIEDVPQIVDKTVLGQEIIESLLYCDPNTRVTIRKEHEVPFYKHQSRVVFGANGLIDPTNIDEYIAIGGYGALASALTGLSPEHVIDQVQRSGLRGRGGGGFPTGRKWQICRARPGDKKYNICNADEGDP
ncbi:MAG: NADH-quinone oxidoreductase subunit F, partial [Phycisphaerae bacterium]|nr:NADH-quinone oxidoreductase subunit F [Phycisphaerae bacterium]